MSGYKGKCRSCNADIYWAQLRGKPHPVDRTPYSNGNLVLTLQPSSDVLLAEPFDKENSQRRSRFISHFATCPNAAKHRRANE